MALAAGSRLGPYEILAAIGKGGMGEIYKARDGRLGRTIAIKILPAQFSSDPVRRARFEREARAVAALSHPNVVTIFDVDLDSDPPYAVQELLEGETLRAVLAAGPLPVQRAVDYGRQLALGLAAAHERGIVHRDLKPENVVITVEGRAKVLDFGLAKAEPEPEPGAALSQLSTEQRVTRAGAVFGTVAYMSPEQARGEAVDARSDVFALGAILFEMLSGALAFPGPSVAETIAGILGRDVASLPSASVPPTLARIVTRCLEKRREDRFQSALDLAFALESSLEAPAAARPRDSVPRRWRSRAALLLAALAGLAAGALLRSSGQPSVGSRQSAMRFSIPLPEGTTLEDYASASLAISPSGDKLAFVAKRAGIPRLYVRGLDATSAQELPGTEGASSPFFSPDGQWLGFESRARVKKIPVAGGTPQTLAASPFFAGAAWGLGDVIVFQPTFMSGLWRVSAQGGVAERLTALDRAAGDRGHIWPDLAPGGRDALFTIWTGGAFDEAKLGLASLENGRHAVLLDNAYCGRFGGPDRILFVRGGRLLVVRYDPRARQVVGSPVLVEEAVRSETTNGSALFTASRAVLLYASGSAGSPQRSLVWVDRQGHESPAVDVVRGFNTARLSPIDDRIATSVESDILSLWMWTPRKRALTRLSFNPDDHSVAWSSDGKRVVFQSGRNGTHQVYVASADASGREQQVTHGDRDSYVLDWSPDGRLVALTQFAPETGADIWLVDPDGAGPLRPFARTPFFESKAAFSPDGRRLAYVSDESGRDEVYVRRLDGEGKTQVSVDAGSEPAWSRAGDEIFYRGKDSMMAARLGFNLDAQAPVALFADRYFFSKDQCRTYDVGKDGRFLMIRAVDESPVRELQVVMGW